MEKGWHLIFSLSHNYIINAIYGVKVSDNLRRNLNVKEFRQNNFLLDL